LVYQGKAYNPLETFESIETLDRTIKDKSRDRSIPLKIYFPVGKTNSPVILFSHGLGGSRNGCSYLGKHWAGRGYVAVFMQHVGSDESVWKDVGPLRRMFALKKAASSKNFMLRVQDVSAVLDQLENLNQKSDFPFIRQDGSFQSGHVRSLIWCADDSSSFWRENSPLKKA
jgi:predicted dienelactone hydrolase